MGARRRRRAAHQRRAAGAIPESLAALARSPQSDTSKRPGPASLLRHIVAIKEAIVAIVEGGNLSEEEAAAAMLDIFEGVATPSQIGAFATALRMKGETVEEIAGLARVMRDYSTRVQLEGDVVDLVGTGGDASNTFNISTISAMVVAAAGGKVAKHGNVGISSGCGAADILRAFGIATDLDAANVAACVQQTGFGFMF